MVAIVAMKPVIAMLAISQNPERVSNILRSSTRTTRVSGMGANSVRRPVRTAWSAESMVVAVMPLSSLVGCRR